MTQRSKHSFQAGAGLLASGMHGTSEETYQLERELVMDLQEDAPRADTAPKSIKSTGKVKQW